MFSMPSHWEFIAILAVALLIFGPRIPRVARGIGKSIVSFKQGLRGVGAREDSEDDDG